MGPDGMTVDDAGNAYLTLGKAVTVFDKTGKQIAKIDMPEGTTKRLLRRQGEADAVHHRRHEPLFDRDEGEGRGAAMMHSTRGARRPEPKKVKDLNQHEQGDENGYVQKGDGQGIQRQSTTEVHSFAEPEAQDAADSQGYQRNGHARWADIGSRKKIDCRQSHQGGACQQNQWKAVRNPTPRPHVKKGQEEVCEKTQTPRRGD